MKHAATRIYRSFAVNVLRVASTCWVEGIKPRLPNEIASPDII